MLGDISKRLLKRNAEGLTNEEGSATTRAQAPPGTGRRVAVVAVVGITVEKFQGSRYITDGTRCVRRSRQVGDARPTSERDHHEYHAKPRCHGRLNKVTLLQGTKVALIRRLLVVFRQSPLLRAPLELQRKNNLQ